MLTQKDKEFVKTVDVSKWQMCSDKYWALWVKVRTYVMENHKDNQLGKIDEILKACQIRFGKEELEKRKNGQE